MAVFAKRRMRTFPVTACQLFDHPVRTCSAITGNFHVDFPLNVVVQTGSSLTIPVRLAPAGSLIKAGMEGNEPVILAEAFAQPMLRTAERMSRVAGSFGIQASNKQAEAVSNNVT